MKKELNILFLGAGKRLSLLEQFQRAAEKENIGVNLYSFELKAAVPICSIAEIQIAPKFMDSKFDTALVNFIKAKSIDIVIPNMDSATVALSRLKMRLSELGCHVIVSSNELCTAMYDKESSAKWFNQQGIKIPSENDFPLIAKAKTGYGARDQFLLHTQAELDSFKERTDFTQYYLQSYIENTTEYTVDAYVDNEGVVENIYTRIRIEVADGEVIFSNSHYNEDIVSITRKVLSQPGWKGPITLQYLQNNEHCYLVEINPRFGGGVTHAIHAGLDMPRWIIQESLGSYQSEPVNWKNGSLMTRAYRDIFL